MNIRNSVLLRLVRNLRLNVAVPKDLLRLRGNREVHSLVSELLIGILVTVSLCHYVFAEEIKVNGAEIEWHKYYDKVFINTSSENLPKLTESDGKIELYFPAAAAERFVAVQKKSPRIKKVYSVQNEGEGTKVIVELKRDVDHEIAVIYGKNQIELDILDKKGAVVVAVPEKEEIPDVVPKIAPSEPPIKVNLLPQTPEKPAKISKVLKGKIIVVDPGHGGSDPGAFAFNGVLEKTLTLRTSVYLVKYLKSYGATVYLTRRGDAKRELKDTVEFTERVKADIYVGMHYNAINNTSMSGTETYYFTPQSNRFAGLVHKRMVMNLKRTDRGVRRANLYTVRRIEVPAIIVEPVYITNMQEGILAESPSFEQEIARSVGEGIRDYFSR